MSNVLPIRIQAREQIQRDRVGRAILARIVERNARPGDVHPLPKKQLRALLSYQPIAYLNGLRRIELRPRISENVGEPFGYYLRAERLIVLYSTPAAPWKVPADLLGFRQNVSYFGAAVSEMGSDCIVEWRSRADLAKFMYCSVFLHELGHHHDFQYRHKRPLPRGRKFKEESAELHMRRLRRAGWGLALWEQLVETGELDEG
jgi:hypothetical protein